MEKKQNDRPSMVTPECYLSVNISKHKLHSMLRKLPVNVHDCMIKIKPKQNDQTEVKNFPFL
jgi:hypothetical protein